MPGPIIPTSDDKVLKKYTLQPRSAQILELLGAQILGAVDENDLRNIATPAVCKKYVLLLADKLNDEMLKTQFYVSDKTIPIEGQEIVLYKYSESQQSLCNSFGFYVMRILQLIFLCMCHVSTNPVPSFDETGGPAVGSTPSIDTTKFKTVNMLEDFIDKKNKKIGNRREIAGILFDAIDTDQPSTSSDDPRIFLSSTGDYRYWYDPVQHKVGFTTKDNKHYYMDFMLSYSGSEKNPFDPSSRMAILLFKEGDAASKPYKWFTKDTFGQPYRHKDGDRKDEHHETERAYREIIFSSAAERIIKSRGDNDDSAKIFNKKSDVTTAQASGTIVFSNPLYAIQHAMLTSSYVEGGYVYDIGDIAGVQNKLRAWIGSFMDIAFGDIYEKITSKDGKTYIIEKNKVKWQVVQKPAADERNSQAQEVRVKLGNLFTQFKAPPKVSRDMLMNSIQTNSRGWNSYYYYYKEFTDMQTQMGEFATTMLFSGSAGLPPLVLWQTTEKGRTFKVNPALIGIGAKKIEFAFAEMRKTMYNLYGKTLVNVIKIGEAMQLMVDEMPRIGGHLATFKTNRIQTRKKQKKYSRKRKNRD